MKRQHPHFLFLFLTFCSVLGFAQQNQDCQTKKGIKTCIKKNREGIVTSIERYKISTLHGIQETFYPNGIKKAVEKYVDGNKEGISKTYFANGQVSSIIEYTRHRENGKYITYYENGKLRQKSTKIIDPKDDRKSVLHGRHQFWGKDGCKKLDANFDKGEKHGRYREYQNCVLVQDHEYIQGKKSGPFATYYANGKIKTKGTMFDPKAKEIKGYRPPFHGTFESYFENGQIKEHTEYQWGIKTGKSYTYTPNGNTSLLYHVLSDSTASETRYFEDTNQPRFYKEYKLFNGKKIDHGVERTWNETGLLINENHYFDGKVHGDWRSWYENGQLATQAHSTHGKNDGPYLTYYKNGQIKNSTHYVIANNGYQNNEQGWSRKYEEDGTPIFFTYNDTTFKVISKLNFTAGKITQFTHHRLFNLEYFESGEIYSISFPALRYGNILQLKYYRTGELKNIELIDSEQGEVIEYSFTPQRACIAAEHAFNNSIVFKKDLEKTKTFIDQIGWTRPTITALNGSNINGPFSIVSSLGDTLFQCQFKDGLADGTSWLIAPGSTDTLFVHRFDNGYPVGWNYDYNGPSKIWTKEYFNANHEKVWFEQKWLNGKLEKKRYPNELGDTVLVEYHENNVLESKKNESTKETWFYTDKGYITSSYIRPIREKDSLVYTSYFANDETKKIRTIQSSVAGKYEGKSWSFNEAGDTISLTTYHLGKRFGPYFYNNLKKNSRSWGNFINDKQEGWVYTRKDNVLDSLFYINGKAQVEKPTGPCTCIDTSEVYNNQYFLSLSSFIELDHVQRYMPPNIQWAPEFNLGSVFYSGSISGSNRDAEAFSMYLIPFTSFAFYTPINHALKVTLNPCHTPPYLTKMHMNYYRSYDNRLLSIGINTNKIRFDFEKGPLAGNQLLINAKRFEFKKDRGISIELDEASLNCSPIRINNFLVIDSLKVYGAYISGYKNNRDAFYKDENLTPELRKEFAGIYADSCYYHFDFKYDNTSYTLQGFSTLPFLLGTNLATGFLEFDDVAIDNNIYTFKKLGLTIPESELQSILESHQLSNILFVPGGNETLKIRFYAH